MFLGKIILIHSSKFLPTHTQVAVYGYLCFLPNNVTMNANSYLEVLNDLLLQIFHVHESDNFMYDSAPLSKSFCAEVQQGC